MKVFLLGVLLSCISLRGWAQPSTAPVISALLDRQTAAWNKGDIEAFMQTYWKSDSLVFVGKNGVTYGWQNTFNNYKKNYPDKTAMGQLKFTMVRMEQLSARIYNVIGKWHLTRAIGNLQGHYTLIVRKINGTWLIVQDHSS